MSLSDGAPSIPKRQAQEAILAVLRPIAPWVARRLGPITMGMLQEDKILDQLPADFLHAAARHFWMDGALRGIGWKYDPASRTFTRT